MPGTVRDMRSRVSAGLLLYRKGHGLLEVFLAHPGGPFFTRKDEGHWTIPKGEVERGEELLMTAIREFQEEIGMSIDPRSEFIELGSIRQKGGKIVHAWAVEGDRDDTFPILSVTFKMEWPPGSGQMQKFPEIDRAQFFPLVQARRKIKETQIPLLDRLEETLAQRPNG